MAANEIYQIREAHPNISDLELHFYNMKYHGFHDEELERGITRPIFYLYDDNNFSLISFMVPEHSSPYRFKNGEILYNGEELPFKTIKATHLGYKLPYYYFRGTISPLHPTLDNENILNTNFNPQCTGCDFCLYGYRQRHLKNISAEKGIEMIKNETNMADFNDLKEIAIVTGRFPSETELKNHLTGIIDNSYENEFSGRILYIGSQLTSPEAISEVLHKLDKPEQFKYVYTVERFFDREKVMHGKKGKKTLPEIVEDVKCINSLGVKDLQYSYLVGIENLKEFKKGAEVFVPYATPHISIFRKTGLEANENTIAEDYKKFGAEFICQIREHYEELYGKKIIGNNFANLWPFPVDRIDISSYLEKIER